MPNWGRLHRAGTNSNKHINAKCHMPRSDKEGWRTSVNASLIYFSWVTAQVAYRTSAHASSNLLQIRDLNFPAPNATWSIRSDSAAVRKIQAALHRVKHWPKYQQKQEAWVLWNSVQHMSEGFLGLHKTVAKEKIGKADVRCLLTPDETCPFLYPFEMFNRYVGADF